MGSNSFGFFLRTSSHLSPSLWNSWLTGSSSGAVIFGNKYDLDSICLVILIYSQFLLECPNHRWAFAYCLAYMVFNIVYVRLSGRVIYPGLDWKSWTTLPMVLGPLVLMKIAHLFFLYIQKKCKFKRHNGFRRVDLH